MPENHISCPGIEPIATYLRSTRMPTHLTKSPVCLLLLAELNSNDPLEKVHQDYKVLQEVGPVKYVLCCYLLLLAERHASTDF